MLTERDPIDAVNPGKAKTLPPDAQIQIQATELEVRQALSFLRVFLQDRQVGNSARGTAEIVLAEVLNNITEHAYARTSPGPIRITLTLAEQSLRIRVSDQGRPLPATVMALTRLPHVTSGLHDLPEGGFGWPLIRGLSEEMNYCRESDMNHLSLRLSLTSTYP